LFPYGNSLAAVAREVAMFYPGLCLGAGRKRNIGNREVPLAIVVVLRQDQRLSRTIDRIRLGWARTMAMPSASSNRIRPFLAKNTFLGRLPDIILDTLVRKGQLKTFAKGAPVYRRGDPGDSLFVLIEGRIKLTNTNLGGKEIVLHYVGAGEMFGEIAALDGGERAADAIALEDSEAFVVCTRDLLPALTGHPQAMLAILKALCEKIRVAAAIVEDNTLEMRGRTARGLLRLAQQQGRRGADGTVQLTITQEELGKYLAMSRANVNRQLGHLKMANVIKISGTEISIADEVALADLAHASSAKD
jgi:CRP/FNR family transcriptional regulator, cyclic AMP receptor protein